MLSSLLLRGTLIKGCIQIIPNTPDLLRDTYQPIRHLLNHTQSIGTTLLDRAAIIQWLCAAYLSYLLLIFHSLLKLKSHNAQKDAPCAQMPP